MGLLEKLTGKEDTLQKLLDMKDQAARARNAYDAEAWLNRAFFLGEQWTEWHNNTIREIPRTPANDDKGIPDEENLPRPVFNKIQSYIYTAQAETLQDKPSFDVLNATNDYQSEMDQDVSKAFLDWVMEPSNIDWDKQLSVATLEALTTPSGWIKWIWDPVLGRPDAVPVPFDALYVDPFALQFKRARYAIHSMFMDAAAAEDMFPGITIDKGDIGHVDEFKTKLMRDMGSATAAQGVTINELWMKPTPKYPQGCYALFTGRKLLKIEDKLPYPHLRADGGRLPFSQLGSLERTDSMYYTSPVTALRPSQMVWNKFIAQAIQVQDAFANPKWGIPLELQMKNMPNSSPRQILRWEGPTGVKPEIIVPPNMPDFSRLLDTFEQQMMHVVAVHEVSQGQVPGRVEAAKAIELLQTSDKGRYKHLLDTIDSAVAEGGWQMLMLAREYLPDKTMIPIYSQDGGATSIKQWRKGAMEPSTRVRTVRMSGLGRTRAQREDRVTNMFINGLLPPTVAADLLELPRNTFTNPKARDANLARVENNEMAHGAPDVENLEGFPVQPNSWDDHETHLHEHNEYRKSAEFRSLPEDNKTFFAFHCDRHEKLWIMELAKQAQRAAAAQGMVPGGGPAQGGAAPTGAPPGAGGQSDGGPMFMQPQVGPGANPAHP